MVLVLAIHTVATASATVPFAMIMLRCDGLYGLYRCFLVQLWQQYCVKNPDTVLNPMLAVTL